MHKNQRIIFLGEIPHQIRYLTKYFKVRFMLFKRDSSLLISILKTMRNLIKEILRFKPHIILVYPSYPLGLSSAIIARFFRKIFVSYGYGNDVSNRRTLLSKMIVRLIIKLSHGFICDCKSLARSVIEMGGQNVSIIPMGLDISEFSSAPLRKIKNMIVCIVNFNLAYWKGVDLLIRALKDLPDIHLTLIGNGSQRKKMILLTKNLDLCDRIKFTGFISREELSKHLLNATLYVLPSRASFIEGTNRSTLEAMHCGLPVIVTSTGGQVDLVSNEINGLIVEPGNLGQLIKAIRRLLGDPNLREKMGKNNRIKAKEYLPNVLSYKRYKYLMRFLKKKNNS